MKFLCPKCGSMQSGLTNEILKKQLAAGESISAYCIQCDHEFPLSEADAADLRQKVAAGIL